MFFCDATMFSRCRAINRIGLWSRRCSRSITVSADCNRSGFTCRSLFFSLHLRCWSRSSFTVCSSAVLASSANGWIALAAAAWYGLHPANADTVNYVIASSEVISTLGVIASFAVYFAFPRLRKSSLRVPPAGIAILAKPTAAIFPVLFVMYRLLFEYRETRLAETRLQRAGQIAAPFVICATVLLFVQQMTPHTWIAGAANEHNYLITQPYVALLYFKTFFWPSGLSADYDLIAFAITDDPRFWAGFAFSVLFIAVAVAVSVFKKTRVIGFGLFWFLIALLPTSLLPLAEVVNDHRTFLPYIGLVIAVAGAAGLLVAR